MFSNDDLPTLDLPKNATSGTPRRGGVRVPKNAPLNVILSISRLGSNLLKFKSCRSVLVRREDDAVISACVSAVEDVTTEEGRVPSRTASRLWISDSMFFLISLADMTCHGGKCTDFFGVLFILEEDDDDDDALGDVFCLVSFPFFFLL